MSDEQTFIEGVVADYAEMGHATAKDDVTLVSHDGNEVTLEPVFSGAEQSGVRIISNGNDSGAFSFESGTFVKDFGAAMREELNI